MAAFGARGDGRPAPAPARRWWSAEAWVD